MAKIYPESIVLDAYNFREMNSLNDTEPVNYKSLLLKLNVQTLYRPLSDSFSGMCLKRGDKKFILINSNHSRGRQHFTMAHEFYHLFIQEDFTPHCCNPGQASESPVERLADAFSSCFLMPEMGIKKMMPANELREKNVSIATLLKLEHYFSVSHLALLTRLKGLGLISASEYDHYSKIPIKRTASEYGYDLSLYEKGNEGVVIGDYGVRARGLFDKGKISESHYWELMEAIGVDLTAEINEQE
ncbi:MAG: hypothetical protein H6Q13_1389 [Bacteroidetes bacterium]|nr:hypothetical protein [Bacteroidota bacterium]